MANFLKSLFSRKPSSSRAPAFAGHLYPEEPDALRRKLAPMLEHRRAEAPAFGALRGLVLPFGELDFIAPSLSPGLSLLASPTHKEQIERVVLLAAAQRIPFRGLALSGVDAWKTPLGDCWCDTKMNQALLERFAGSDDVRVLDAAHGPEPAIEVLLPALQSVFGAGKNQTPLITPILVGDGGAEPLASVLDAVWGGEGVLVVLATEGAVGVSAQDAERLGEELERAVISREPGAITRHHASGRVPLKAMLARAARDADAKVCALARSHSMSEEVARLRVVSEREEELVVGYSSFAFGTSG